MNEKQKLILVGLITGTITALLIGFTFAYWTWQSTSEQRTLVSFTIGDGFSCSADGGGNITSSDVQLMPTDCTDTAHAIKRTVKVNTTQNSGKTVYLYMNLKVDSIGTNLANSENFRYALTRESTSCRDGVVNSGNFKNTNTNTELKLLDEEIYSETTTNDTYYLWIWLDKEETNNNTQNQTFSLSLTGSCTDHESPKAHVNFGNSSQFFKDSAYRDKITSVSIVNEINVPTGATSWELGVAPSNSSDVIAWLEDDNSGNGTYDLKIGSNEPMYGEGDFSSGLSGLVNATSVNLSGLNASNITNTSAMFGGIGQYAENLSLVLGNNFNASNVITMSSMFAGMGSYSNNITLDLGNNFNASKATDMSFMFGSLGSSATNSITLNLGNNFNASNVINIFSMFAGIGGYESIESIILNLGNNFNAKNVINMASMFSGIGVTVTNLNIDLGQNFNTSNVKNMRQMFAGTGRNSTNLILVLGNHFDTSNVIDMSSMFGGVGQNVVNFSLDLGNRFNTINVIDMSSMFGSLGQNSVSFSLKLGNHFDTSNVTNMYAMFGGVGNRSQTKFTVDLSKGNFDNVSNYTSMFNQFGANGTILVKDSNAQNWIIGKNSTWGTNFSVSNVLIK